MSSEQELVGVEEPAVGREVRKKITSCDTRERLRASGRNGDEVRR